MNTKKRFIQLVLATAMLSLLVLTPLSAQAQAENGQAETVIISGELQEIANMWFVVDGDTEYHIAIPPSNDTESNAFSILQKGRQVEIEGFVDDRGNGYHIFPMYIRAGNNTVTIVPGPGRFGDRRGMNADRGFGPGPRQNDDDDFRNRGGRRSPERRQNW